MPLLPPQATEVDLSAQNLGDEDIARLAEELALNGTVTTLQSINLGFNQVGDAGAASLASSLEKNTTLRSINLSLNKVGAAGAASLASALEKNTTLQSIKLSTNEVGAAGAASLEKINSLLAANEQRAAAKPSDQPSSAIPQSAHHALPLPPDAWVDLTASLAAAA